MEPGAKAHESLIAMAAALRDAHGLITIFITIYIINILNY